MEALTLGRSANWTWRQRQFKKEFSRAGILNKKRILEIGFGDGKMLCWLSGYGFDAVGVEIIPELVKAGRERCFSVYEYEIAAIDTEPAPFEERKFDAVVAFDVAEHLTAEELQCLFPRLSALLVQGGKVILRFPNGESPFSTPIQNGDHTHRTYLCRAKLRHLCLGSGLELERYDNAARVAGKASTAWLKWIIFKLRDCIELVLGGLYYNHRRPMDPVATAVLRKE